MDEITKHAAPRAEDGFDRDDPSAGQLAIISGATVVLLTLICIGLYWFYTVSDEHVEYQQVLAPQSQELKAIHEREEKHLNTYGYINKEKGIVRVPIDRAMELIETEAREGKLSYNMKTYAVKPEQPAAPATPAVAAPIAQC